MDLVHFILNLAALLLWVKWRSQAAPTPAVSPSLAVGSLSRRPRPHTPWLLPAALMALLLGRTFFYWQLSPASDWTATLDLAVVTLSFRSDFAGQMLLYSLASFVAWLVVFHLSLLFLVIADRDIAAPVPGMRSVRAQLGWLTHRPLAIKLLLPWFALALTWIAASFVLPRLDLSPPAGSLVRILGQSALVSTAAFLSWKYVITGLLLLHLLHSYIYLGNHPFWSFIEETGRQCLRPLRWCPLQLGRMDLAPAAGAAAAWFGAKYAALGLTWIYGHLPP
ncbi:MAG: hypothetical protein EXS29_03145 [Pedosphaera sp.]|nr:hypothetical protein [Pedosphaera sp.]